MQPMLAVNITDINNIPYPCLVSKQINGVRCLVSNRTALNKDFKPFKNKYLQSVLKDQAYEGLDGVLIGDESSFDTVDGVPEFTFYVFDNFKTPTIPFSRRFMTLPKKLAHVVIIPQHYVMCVNSLIELETKYHKEGYNGVVVRNIDGVYKFGRSTERECYMGVVAKEIVVSDNIANTPIHTTPIVSNINQRLQLSA